MTLHLVKLCVGAGSIEDLAAWQASRGARPRVGGKPQLAHTTFQTPKRQEELLDGGSLYWVIKGVIQVRQRIVGFDTGEKDDGSACCLILLDPGLVPVRPVRRKPFQGWRYLSAADAPDDLKGGETAAAALAEMPATMRRDLADLGLL
ncbi:MAG: DUF1489 domain-containing protein [Hyphomicrobiaceae bacterium]|nr:DUF1489 domain-containing protein [Hyphomicrobiaceae bacterium]